MLTVIFISKEVAKAVLNLSLTHAYLETKPCLNSLL